MAFGHQNKGPGQIAAICHDCDHWGRRAGLGSSDGGGGRAGVGAE